MIKHQFYHYSMYYYTVCQRSLFIGSLLVFFILFYEGWSTLMAFHPHQRIACYLSAFSYLDGLYSFGRNALSANVVRDNETVIIAVEAGAVCVENEFHGVIVDTGCRRRGGGFLWRG